MATDPAKCSLARMLTQAYAPCALTAMLLNIDPRTLAAYLKRSGLSPTPPPIPLPATTPRHIAELATQFVPDGKTPLALDMLLTHLSRLTLADRLLLFREISNLLRQMPIDPDDSDSDDTLILAAKGRHA